MTSEKPVIVAARRTPIGRLGGSLRHLGVDALAAPVLNALIADGGVAADEVDDVILGNAAGPGGNPARLCALAAGFPLTVPGLTVDRQCGSGLEAINLAARLIEARAGEVYIAGGVESASTAPWRLERPASLYGAPRIYERARFAPDSIGDPDMGVAAEDVARHYGISRERQDRYALGSHLKAVAAQRNGRFDDEIVSLSVSGTTSGQPAGLVGRDECPRPDTSMERLTVLPPAFVIDGRVTAGNSCPINDGAAAVLIVSAARFRSMGARAGLRVLDSAAAGVDPRLLGTGPIASTRALMARTAGLTMEAIDLVEFNEAFAAQVLACLDTLKIPETKVNIGGGAIALGHPFGASGAILMVRLFTELVRRTTTPKDARVGLATLGIAGGLGISTLVEAISS
jgi:acetyl-CoA C-acetyltransferase